MQEQSAAASRTIRTRFTALPGDVRGAIWILVASFFLTIMVTMIKMVGDRLPVSQILFVRQTVMILVVLPTILKFYPDSIRTKRPWHHAARVGLALIGMFAGFTAVVHLPLADATAIGFAKSFFVTIFAILFLKEVVGWRRWIAVIVGFIGVLIMLKPSAAGINTYGVLAVVGAAAAGLVMILIRYLSRFDQPITILTYQSVWVGVIVAPLAFYAWVWPSLSEWALLAAIGVVSAAGQTCNIRAFAAGEATAIASLDYVRLIWATLIGFAVFSDLPTLSTLVGAAIVLAASLYTIHREARHGQRLTRSSTGRSFTNT